MLAIKYPEPDFRIKEMKGKKFLFDPLRKKWILFTPEEWVRQNFVQYLTRVMNYPAALIALEKEISLGELKKRFDILIYDTNHLPWMMIECKEMNTELDEEVLQQVLRYNIAIPVQFIVITNGEQSFGWQKVNNRLDSINELPEIR
jgi:hypothetical protein